MSFLADKIKTRFNERTALPLISWCLGLVCFLFMFIFRYREPWHWDDLAYLKNMIIEMPSELLLGRPGFMYPFIFIWHVLREYFNSDFYVVEKLIRVANITFMTLAYVLLFRILVYFKFRKVLSVLTVLFLLSELSFSIVSSRVGDSALMYLCVTASYWFFIKAHESQSKKYLMISAGLFAYAFLVREPALFYFPFFPIMLIYFKTKNLLLKRKSYAIASGLFFLICALVPLLMFATYGQRYINSYHNSSSHGYFIQFSDLLSKISIIGEALINLNLLPLAVSGLILFCVRGDFQKFFGLIVATLGPTFLTLLASNDGFLTEPRLFPGLFFILAFGLAYFVSSVSELISSKPGRIMSVLAASAVIFIVSVVRFLPEYNRDVERISYFQNYYQKIKPLLGDKVAFIVGEESLYVLYRSRADGIRPGIISPGWSWPKGELVKKIDDALDSGLRIIYDPKSRAYKEEKRGQDLDEMTEKFKLTESQNGFFEVQKKD